MSFFANFIRQYEMVLLLSSGIDRRESALLLLFRAVPEGLLLPTVTDMGETATAGDVTMTCTLSGTVDDCQFIRLFRFVVL